MIGFNGLGTQSEWGIFFLLLALAILLIGTLILCIVHRISQHFYLGKKKAIIMYVATIILMVIFLGYILASMGISVSL